VPLGSVRGPLQFTERLMQPLEHVQDTTNRLLALVLGGAYLSNGSKISYPFFRRVHPSIKEEILSLKALLRENRDRGRGGSLCELLAGLAKLVRTRIGGEPGHSREVTVEVVRGYERNSYQDPQFRPVKALCEYVRERLEPYLVGAYIHGSLSTMDCTGYSDLDTLFIIRQEILEDPDQVRELERLFIKSTRYLYEFDPLQHHGHFFLAESDLRYYSQATLPLSAIELSTSILSRGNHLTFRLRNTQRESEERFLTSARLVRRYIDKDRPRLATPYYLKGFLSHFMMLPALFLQVQGQYVSKKDSFHIMREQIPPDTWRCMEQVSEIRRTWTQTSSGVRRNLMKTMAKWNPLLCPSLAIRMSKGLSVTPEILNDGLLSEMSDFTDYLLKLSGLHEDRECRLY
jgi:hypothetical protein